MTTSTTAPPDSGDSSRPDRDRGLDRLLSPNSVAVIGASQTRGAIGSTLHRNLQRGFEGVVHAVNPRGGTINGAPALTDAGELPYGVDMAVAAVPAPAVLSTVEACAERGVGGVTVLTAGFSETGGDGAALQAELADVTARTGIRLIGPNCIGFMNTHAGVMANFAIFPEQPMPIPGPVALVSQSGGFGSYITLKSLLAGLRLGWFVSTGNEVDVNVAQLLEQLVERDEVEVLLVCTETLRDPGTFIAAVRRAAELDKPVVMLKAGRSEEAARAVMSHTASVVGAADVFDAVCAQYGVIVVDTMEELLDLGMIFQDGRRARGNGLGIMTSSGGAGVLMVDCAVGEGLTVPTIPDDEVAALEALMPQPFHGDVHNPVDTTAQITGDPGRYAPALRAVRDASVVDVFTTVTWAYPGPMNDAIIAGYESTDKPFAVLSTDWMEDFQSAGVPTYTDPKRAIRALGVLAEFSGRTRGARPEDEPAPGVDHARIVELFGRAGANKTLQESDATNVLAAYGVPVTRQTLVTSADEAAARAADFDGAVVLKAMSPELPHKSDYGAVRVGLRGADAVRVAYDEMLADVGARAPHATIGGVLVQEMVPARLELTCGVTRDPVFGPMVSVGLGGVLVEILAAPVLLRPPFGRDDVAAALARIAGGRLVSARRGLTEPEIEAASAIIVGLGRLVLDHPEIDEIDVNPVRVDNGRAVAADALIVLGDGGGAN